MQHLDAATKLPHPCLALHQMLQSLPRPCLGALLPTQGEVQLHQDLVVARLSLHLAGALMHPKSCRS
jgi:hypothetical protein